MASFADAPAGDIAVGEKIFRTKCSQVRNVGFDGRKDDGFWWWVVVICVFCVQPPPLSHGTIIGLLPT
jgi:hypothetical protein